MTNRLELIAFAVTMVSFCATVLHQTWRMSQAVSGMRYELEKQDIRLENLHNVQELSFNGYREKIEHFISRTRGEIQDISARLGSTEEFLAKTTDFVRRR